MPIEIDEVLDWRSRTVVDSDGRKIGTFDEIYLDEGTDEPAWAAVKTGALGLRRRVVPIAEAAFDGKSVRVPFTKEQVKSAPTIDSDGWVPERDQATILRHYGVTAGESRAGADDRPGAMPPEAGPAESSESPGSTGDEDSEARPSDPQLEGIRLKRYTVTETVTRRSDFGGR